MPTCNIDQQGKTIRFVLGALVEAIGLLLGVLWFLDWVPSWVIWPAVGVWIVGISLLVQALLGWCAARAIGIDTPR